MSDFRRGDYVAYFYKGEPVYYATVLRSKGMGNLMLIRWHYKDSPCQVVDKDNFELVYK